MIKYIISTSLLEALGRFRGRDDNWIARSQATRLSFRWIFGLDFSLAVIRSDMPQFEIENSKLHEAVHHEQEKRLGFSEYHRQYKENARLYGYWLNPFEAEARRAEIHK